MGGSQKLFEERQKRIKEKMLGTHLLFPRCFERPIAWRVFRGKEQNILCGRVCAALLGFLPSFEGETLFCWMG